MSANTQPIGIAHQIPTRPIDGIAAKTYASSTLVPSEMTVKTIDIAGFPTPRYRP